MQVKRIANKITKLLGNGSMWLNVRYRTINLHQFTGLSWDLVGIYPLVMSK
jgi:hypothetical protein